MIELNEQDRELINYLQSNFPVCDDPFAKVAKALGREKCELINRLNELQALKVIRRFGAVLNHKKVGASTLAALRVPDDKVSQTAELVNAYAEVNHNYLREHQYNMWFVVTAKTQQRVDEVLTEITSKTGFLLLNLPMVKSHHINLAFDL